MTNDNNTRIRMHNNWNWHLSCRGALKMHCRSAVTGATRHQCPFNGSCRSSCRRVWLRDAATATGTAQNHRDVRSDLRHNTFETVRTT